MTENLIIDKCKKFIAYSLYGPVSKYNVGIIENCKLRDKIYPEFDFLVYYDSTVPHTTIDQLRNFSFVHLIKKSGGSIYSATKMMWRFEEFFSQEPKIILSRDADSLINIKERLAVEQWLATDKHAHIMRDHKFHKSLIMGGMWGIRTTPDWNMSNLREVYKSIMSDVRNNNTGWGFDQTFLNSHVYPIIKNTSVKHCSHNRFESDCIDFPPSSYNNFIGNYFM